jgi:hypothetical protein
MSGEDAERCILCYEQMHVALYRPTTAAAGCCVEGDCTRLGCGHALHTACMVNSLVSTQGKCPLCNMSRPFQDMTYRQRLQYEAECKRSLACVKRDPGVRAGLADLAAFNAELRTKQDEFRQRTLAFKKQLREELQVERLLKDIRMLTRETCTRARAVAKSHGGLTQQAFETLESTGSLPLWLFNTSRLSRFRAYQAERFFFRE